MLLFWVGVCLFSVWLGVWYSLHAVPLLSAFSALSALCFCLSDIPSRAQALVYCGTFLVFLLLYKVRQSKKVSAKRN
ncbi:MAG: hypothetical protein IJY12_01790 [Clostridia bacterium]|nr:hypothetical protein [Clostridia bacterium]